MALRWRIAGAAAWFAAVLPVLVAGCGQSEDNTATALVVKPGIQTGTPTSPGAGTQAGGTPQPAPNEPKDKYAYYGKGDAYTASQKIGRDTWIMWTGGNQNFFRLGSVKAGGFGIPVEYFRLLDSRDRPSRFQRLGLVNEPNFRQATKADQYGLWLDEWLGDDTYPDTKVYGEPTGVVGLRKFPNPKFDQANWNADEYFKKPGSIEPPYLMGMSCGFCHMGFNPLKPPVDPENPRWENLAANLGNQFLKEGGIFFGDGKIVFGGDNGGKGLGNEDVLHHLGETQQRGTSETSRLSYDFINNPNAMNSIFFLENRPAFKETLNPEARKQVASVPLDPDKLAIHHILKDGSDSQGIPIASIRVYVNIGMCGSYWIEQLWNPFNPDVPQKPFDMTVATAKFPEWTETLKRMPNLEDYLATYTPMHLEKAEGGKYSGDLVIPDSYKNGTADQKAKWQIVERGQTVFAENCAFCHSSKQPAGGNDLAALKTLQAYYISGNGQEDDATKKARETVKAYYRTAVAADDFLDNNTLTDDIRYPVSELKTSAARAAATNATGGHIWDQFSSPEYKALPAAGPLTLYNPVTGKNDRVWQPPAGGRGYYRTASLVSIWATAPFLHNNSVGIFNGDPQVPGRVAAFNDAIHKLLWPMDRDGTKTIKRAATRTYLNIRLSVLGSVAREKILAFKPPLPPLLQNVKLPGVFQFVSHDELKDIPGISELDRLSLKIAIPEGTPINLLANINVSDPDKRLAAVLAYLAYAFQTDLAAAAHKLPIGGDELAKIPEQLAKDAMNELLKISEYPDLVEDHGHEYGALLSDDDKKALIEYLKKL
jgi:mono/diheme cytochrome c family protein